MAIVIFILLAGLWAAFLLPSFFDHRRQTPRASTRAFHRSTALLAQVSATTRGERSTQRRRNERRTRALVVLAGGAVVALVVAVWLNSTTWLFVAIAFDVAIATYVTLLLSLKQARITSSQRVVALPAQVEASYAEPEEHVEMANSTVRIIAG